jgi:2-polyprenyl-3-methyl-5-hydroxy-6-metoxy-1,4-benzoquinol methylase
MTGICLSIGDIYDSLVKNFKESNCLTPEEYNKYSNFGPLKINSNMIVKNYNYLRGDYAILKLDEVKSQLKSTVVSDIGSGFGWFQDPILERNLIWQPFDYVKKIEESIIWDLNNAAPENVIQPDFVVFLEVLEHLSNPELGIRNISNHINKGGYMVLSTPNPFSARSRFTSFFKGQLYAFQPKHLLEHHVFVPLPYVVKYFLESNGFQILEHVTLGRIPFPKFKVHVNYLKDIIQYFVLNLIAFFDSSSKGETQAFFVRKK